MASWMVSDGVYALLQHLGGVESGCGEVWEMEELVLSGREKPEQKAARKLRVAPSSLRSWAWLYGPCVFATSSQDSPRTRTFRLAPTLPSMLRLRPRHILRVRRIKNSLLSQLRPIVGDLQSAENELRWLREESQKQASEPKEQRSLLEQYVSRRSRGEPLQYILGSTFFGDLELKCRPGTSIYE